MTGKQDMQMGTPETGSDAILTVASTEWLCQHENGCRHKELSQYLLSSLQSQEQQHLQLWDRRLTHEAKR